MGPAFSWSKCEYFGTTNTYLIFLKTKNAENLLLTSHISPALNVWFTNLCKGLFSQYLFCKQYKIAVEDLWMFSAYRITQSGSITWKDTVMKHPRKELFHWSVSVLKKKSEANNLELPAAGLQVTDFGESPDWVSGPMRVKCSQEKWISSVLRLTKVPSSRSFFFFLLQHNKMRRKLYVLSSREKKK